MPRDVAVVFVHGINAASFDYSVPMREMLRKALPRRLRQYAKYKSVFWADIVRGRSQLYLEQAKTTANIVDNRYRRFIVEGLGDAAAYQKTRNRERHTTRSRKGSATPFSMPKRETIQNAR